MTEKKTIDESYDEMRRKKKQLEFYMDDMDWNERESVSRPSYRTMREIPRHHSSKSEQQEVIVFIFEQKIILLAWIV